MKKRTFLFAILFGFMSMFAYAADSTADILKQAETAAKAGDTAKVAALAKANPGIAAQIAGAATAAAPANAVAIAKAVATAVPSAAASIAVAVAQAAPAQAAQVAATVAQVAPDNALTIAAAVAKAVPSATPEAVASAVSTATGKNISTSDVAKAQSSAAVTQAIQNAVPPIDVGFKGASGS